MKNHEYSSFGIMTHPEVDELMRKEEEALQPLKEKGLVVKVKDGKQSGSKTNFPSFLGVKTW